MNTLLYRYWPGQFHAGLVLGRDLRAGAAERPQEMLYFVHKVCVSTGGVSLYQFVVYVLLSAL